MVSLIKFLRKFKGLSIDSLLYSFNSYSIRDYELQLRNNESVLCRNIIKTFETENASAVKKIIVVLSILVII